GVAAGGGAGPPRSCCKGARCLWQATPTNVHEEVSVRLRKVVGVDIDDHRHLPEKTRATRQVYPRVRTPPRRLLSYLKSGTRARQAWRENCLHPPARCPILPATASAEGFGRPFPLPPDTQLNAPP